MDNLVSVEMLVDKPIASKLIDKGMAEVVFRRVDATYSSFVKCPISPVKDMTQAEQEAERMLSRLNKRLSFPQKRNLFQGKDLFTNQNLRNLAAENALVFNSLKVLNVLSFINTAMSIADIVIDIRGFSKVFAELDSLSSQLSEVSSKLDTLDTRGQLDQIEKLQKLIMDYKDCAEKLEYNEQIDMDKFGELIKTMRAYISKMISGWIKDAYPHDIAVRAVTVLIPAYSQLLSEYLKDYYFQKQRLPNNYDDLISIYDELNNPVFKEKLTDYYLLNIKLSGLEAVDAINQIILLGINGRVLVDDKVELVKVLDENEYKEFFQEVSKAAEKQIDKERMLAKTAAQVMAQTQPG